MMIEPLHIRVYPSSTGWVAQGINCDIILGNRDKERLYEDIRIAASNVRENSGIHARAAAA